MNTRIVFRLLPLVLLPACAADPLLPPMAPPGPVSTPSIPSTPRVGEEGAPSVPRQVPDRQVIVRAAMELTVDDPTATARRVEDLVTAASGFIDASQGGSDDRVRMTVRLPSAALDGVMDGIRPLGDVDRESRSTTDVTSRIIDLGARIESLAALRDRLRSYIDRATTLAEVIQIERELTRVQTEIETLTAELTRMRGQVAMSELGVTLSRPQKLGPVAWLGLKIGEGAEWLFVRK